MRIPAPDQGLNEGLPSQDQPIRTSFSIQNCRAFDITAERIRIAQRAGTSLAYTNQIVGDFPIINMTSITTTYIEPEA